MKSNVWGQRWHSSWGNILHPALSVTHGYSQHHLPLFSSKQLLLVLRCWTADEVLHKLDRVTGKVFPSPSDSSRQGGCWLPACMHSLLGIWDLGVEWVTGGRAVYGIHSLPTRIVENHLQ